EGEVLDGAAFLDVFVDVVLLGGLVDRAAPAADHQAVAGVRRVAAAAAGDEQRGHRGHQKRRCGLLPLSAQHSLLTVGFGRAERDFPWLDRVAPGSGAETY